MIPNLAIFFSPHLSAKCEADPEFRNSFAVSAALRFACLVLLSGVEQGLSTLRHGMNHEVMLDLQTTSGRQRVFQKAFDKSHLVECHCDLDGVDFIRVEVMMMDETNKPLFTWVAVFQPDGSGDITSSHEAQARKQAKA
jgi:hypothetical protein